MLNISVCAEAVYGTQLSILISRINNIKFSWIIELRCLLEMVNVDRRIRPSIKRSLQPKHYTLNNS